MSDERYIQRCFQLAKLGAGHVSPNPLVGAVLVHAGKIIGEGWHQQYGGPHGEVNCIRSVSPENQALIPLSTLYCNLEPCSHFGKTPPCADLILQHKIPKVVVSNTDPNPLVAGKGLAKLRANGVEVIEGMLEAEGLWLNRSFFTWILACRPFVCLKWAQSADGFIGKTDARIPISSPMALRLVHRWRSELDAILVGTHTAVLDNPKLDARHYSEKKPLRIAIDVQGKIPETHHLLDDSGATWIFGKDRSDDEGDFKNTRFFPLEGQLSIPDLLEKLKQANRASLLVEGGANLLNQFIQNGIWDEIRVVENNQRLGEGVSAPKLPADAVLKDQFQLETDQVRIFAR